MKSMIAFSLFVNIVIGMAVLAPQAVSITSTIVRPENEGNKQDVGVKNSLISNQKVSASTSALVGTTELQACSTYHLHNQIENVGAAGNQSIADITAPSAGSPAVISEKVNKGNFKEIARFYSHPPVTANLNIFGDISGEIWVQANAVNMSYKIEMFDYDPTSTLR